MVGLDAGDAARGKYDSGVAQQRQPKEQIKRDDRLSYVELEFARFRGQEHEESEDDEDLVFSARGRIELCRFAPRMAFPYSRLCYLNASISFRYI